MKIPQPFRFLNELDFAGIVVLGSIFLIGKLVEWSHRWIFP